MADLTGTLLPFQSRIVSTFDALPSATHSGLLILARGLGLRSIITSSLRRYDSPKHLVLVVNATPEDERGMGEDLGMRLRCVGHEMAAKEREKAYKEGRCLSVTSRILIVDLLNKRMDIANITGLVILHAELVTPTSIEAFIVRVFRHYNRTGFIKAFSDEPEQFTFGVSPLQTVMTQLKLRDVLIWPRFHQDVKKDLEPRKADVVELHQPLSPAMDEIQAAVVECMDATLSELKRSNSTLEIEDMTVESALFRSFDRMVHSQLDPIWHRVSPKTRLLTSDLTTLRSLLTYLVTLDSVSFYRFLETLLEAQSEHGGSVVGAVKRDRSPWLFMDAADTVFSVARKRVFTPKPRSVTSTSTSASAAGQDGPEPEEGEFEKYLDQGGPTEEEEQAMREEYEAEEAAIQAASAAGFDVSGFRTPSKPASTTNTNTAAKTNTGGKTREEREGEAVVKKWLEPKGLEATLEELPKWALLKEVLAEIEDQIWRNPRTETTNDTILIMCSSASTCATIKEYLCSASSSLHSGPDDDATADGEGSTKAGRRVMMRRLVEYFYWKSALGKMARNLRFGATGSGSRHGSNTSLPHPHLHSPHAAGAFGTSTGGGDMGPISAALKRKDQWKRGQAPSHKRRRVRGGGAAGANGGDRGAGGTAKASDTNALETEAGEVADLIDASASPGLAGVSSTLASDALAEAFDETAFDEYFGLLALDDLVVVRPYNGDDDDRVLEELRPRWVVMYEPDAAFVRRIECYRAAHKGFAVRVYFLLYGNSVEEQKYLSSIRREKESFERLIKENSVMAIPLEAEVRFGDPGEQELLRTVSSRIAGGGKVVNSGPARVIVDVREFRSSLPSLLHAANFEVVPLTLTIGDYVLSSTMCVERKSITDLIQSFNSGRLYQQCELMSIHYKQPILLIEFDLKKSFSLDTYTETKANAGPNQSDTDLHAKLTLLTLAFPRLRIIWSSSPYNTADIFADLKLNHAEPDPEAAVLVGMEEVVASGAGTGESVAVEGGFSMAPVEVLRSLPGITTKNYRYVMSKVRNLEELCELSQKEIQDMIGVEAGNTLYNFVNTDSRGTA